MNVDQRFEVQLSLNLFEPTCITYVSSVRQKNFFLRSPESRKRSNFGSFSWPPKLPSNRGSCQYYWSLYKYEVEKNLLHNSIE